MRRFSIVTFAFLFVLTMGFLGVRNVDAQTLPSGCSSSTGYSSTTGAACNGMITSNVSGCTSTSGFSTVNGAPCNGATVSTNGSTGAAYSTTYPAGCSSASGFSTTNGAACNVGVNTLLNGCTSTSGFSTTTGINCSQAVAINNSILAAANNGGAPGTGGTGGTPGLPSTGAGGNALINLAILLIAGGVAGVGATYLARRLPVK